MRTKAKGGQLESHTQSKGYGLFTTLCFSWLHEFPSLLAWEMIFSHCHKRVLWTSLQDDSSSSKLSLSKANGSWDFKKQTLKDFQCALTFSTYFSPSPIAPGWLISKEVTTLASHWVKTALLQDLSTLSCSRWSSLCIPCPPDGPSFPWPSSRLEPSLLTKKQELAVKSREEWVAFQSLTFKKSVRLFHSFVYLELQRETSVIKFKKNSGFNCSNMTRVPYIIIFIMKRE